MEKKLMADEKVWDASLANMVMASDFLLIKYRKKLSNGKFKGSPYESLVFGKIVRLQQNSFGYCYMSKERMAWELGCSYEMILSAYKNLEKDKYIRKVSHSKSDQMTHTTPYFADIQKLYDDTYSKLENDKENNIGYENDPARKIRPRWVKDHKKGKNHK